MTALRNSCLTLALLTLGGCAAVPTPFGGAPVEDRSISGLPGPAPVPGPASQPTAPAVEVRPLDRPEPFVPRVATAPQLPPPAPVAPPQPPAPVAPPAPAEPPISRPAPAEPPPAQINTQGNPAVVALLDQAAGHVGSGELDKAAQALERALRIEPRNAGIWHDLGQIRLHQGQYTQAESLASKSNSLAASDQDLRGRNWNLIALARRASGDEAGAQAAEAQQVIAGRE